MRLAGMALLLALMSCAPSVNTASSRVAATPEPSATPQPTPAPTPAPTAQPKPKPVRKPAAKPAAPAPVQPAAIPAQPDLSSFHGLGTWVDVFDHHEDPSFVAGWVADMKAKGVRTIYFESSRYSEPNAVKFPRVAGAFIDHAHANGMKVVAWYPPDFADVDKDLSHSVNAINFTSPKGGRFDAFASDIEYTAGVPDHAERSRRALDYSRRLREAVGPGYALGIIPIAPTSLQVNPGRWRDFPWKPLAEFYDVVMPMNYWTGRSADPQTAAKLTAENVALAKQLTGLPVHIIGGLGDRADAPQVKAYVDASNAGGAIGGGLYDWAITRPDVWGELQRLNR